MPNEIAHRWVSVSDDALTDNETAALDAILPMAMDMGAGKATTCGYDKKGYPLGSMTVALIGEVVIGIAVRNAHDEHDVIVTVMESSTQPHSFTSADPNDADCSVCGGGRLHYLHAEDRNDDEGHGDGIC